MYDVLKATRSSSFTGVYPTQSNAPAVQGTTDTVDTTVVSSLCWPKYGATANYNDFNSTGTRYYKGQYIPYGAEDTDTTEIADFNTPN